MTFITFDMYFIDCIKMMAMMMMIIIMMMQTDNMFSLVLLSFEFLVFPVVLCNKHVFFLEVVHFEQFEKKRRALGTK